MKNIAIIITKLSSGGAERSASNLSMILSKKYNVYLIVFNGKCITYPYSGNLIDLNICESKGITHKTINVFRRVLAIKKIKKEKHIDCTISLLTGPNLVNVLSRHKDKVIISVRAKLSSSISNKWVRKLIIFSSKKADVTVALSEGIKMDLIDEFGIPEEKVQTIYNHCDSELLHLLVKDMPMPDFIQSEYKYIVTMGRLMEVKGQWHLLRSFSRVVKEFEDVKLIIMGEGELEEKLKKLAIDLKIEDKVIFTGYLSNPHFVLKYCEMFVFTSLHEGLGNVLLESLAFDLPIISVDCVAGPREILAPNSDIKAVATEMELCKYGILTPVMSKNHFNAYEPLSYEEKELAKAITIMHSNQELQKKYKASAKKRIHDFDKDKILCQWEQILN